jgi:hypothetical protein
MHLPAANHDDTDWDELSEPMKGKAVVKSKAKTKAKVKAKSKNGKIKGHKPTKAQPQVGRDAHRAARADSSISMPFVIGIDKIVIGPNRRKPLMGTVSTIAASMREIGQLEPIIVRKEEAPVSGSTETTMVPVLVDGHHRVLAGKELGWTELLAVYFYGDALAAERCEISQSIHRKDVTALQRAKWVSRWVQLILEQTMAADAAQPGGRQPGDKGISKTAEEVGYGCDDIRRFTVIASMSEKAMAKAEELSPLDDNMSALLKIAKKNPDEQVAMAEQLGVKK